MKLPDHVHTIDSYPPVKRVFVDGKEVCMAFYANTKKGIVRCYDDPFKMHKYGKRAITRTLHGTVTVEFK